ncbi:MAG: RNA 2',3'-cyclic phosphodiesterase [Sphingomicrobium sp.]
MHRLFVAIRPPEEVRDQLIDIMDDGVAVRWQSDEQLHLTLRFIGEVERPVGEDIAVELERIRFDPFALRLDSVGRFDQRRGGALWAGVTPREELKALAQKVERACQSADLPPERRAYHPHITLARWSKAAPNLDPFVQLHGSLRSEPWQVEDFILYESRLGRDGAHYEEVARYPAKS